jgi:hypothetical protein
MPKTPLRLSLAAIGKKLLKRAAQGGEFRMGGHARLRQMRRRRAAKRGQGAGQQVYMPAEFDKNHLLTAGSNQRPCP